MSQSNRAMDRSVPTYAAIYHPSRLSTIKIDLKIIHVYENKWKNSADNYNWVKLQAKYQMDQNYYEKNYGLIFKFKTSVVINFAFV